MSPALKSLETSQNSKFDKKFTAYTLAGAAALAAPLAAHASGITYVPNVDTTVNQTGSYSFNLSGPSAADVVVSAAPGLNGTDPTNDITFSTSNGAAVLGLPSNALPSGWLIDPTSNGIMWKSNGTLGSFDTVTNTTNGAWSPGTDAFLGFYFQGGNGPQAGWAEITTDKTDSSFEVLSYAFQDQANTPISAGQTVATPEPSSIALLALGAAGLMALRRRRAVAQ